MPLHGAEAFGRSVIRKRAPGVRSTFRAVADPSQAEDALYGKVKRRAAQEIVAAYHQQQLRALLRHVQEALAKLDAGEIDSFEVDDFIHRYKRAAKQLWMFCGSSGSQVLHAAAAIAHMRERGEERDWWAESGPRGERP